LGFILARPKQTWRYTTLGRTQQRASYLLMGPHQTPNTIPRRRGVGGRGGGRGGCDVGGVYGEAAMWVVSTIVRGWGLPAVQGCNVTRGREDLRLVACASLTPTHNTPPCCRAISNRTRHSGPDSDLDSSNVSSRSPGACHGGLRRGGTSGARLQCRLR
jgi:hypothetical protein